MFSKKHTGKPRPRYPRADLRATERRMRIHTSSGIPQPWCQNEDDRERLTRQKILSTGRSTAIRYRLRMQRGLQRGSTLLRIDLSQRSGTRDTSSFWATGQQLAHHANPYDEAAMTRIEHSAGCP